MNQNESKTPLIIEPKKSASFDLFLKSVSSIDIVDESPASINFIITYK